jgi:hypothetical protein
MEALGYGGEGSYIKGWILTLEPKWEEGKYKEIELVKK